MFSAIILGGGSGERMGLGYNKVLYKIKGKTVIEHAVQPFLNDDDFTEVIVVMNRDDFDQGRVLFDDMKVKIIKGGETRQDSVFRGLESTTLNDYVMIHDGARPHLDSSKINALKSAVKQGPATLFTPATESVVLYKDTKVKQYLNRQDIGFVKTPQAFRTTDIKKAYALAREHKHQYTDDASLVMNELKQDIKLVEDDESNIKLTTMDDIKIMEALL